ncbi:MAG: 3-methyladenine glycosylase [Labilithrix sp.]|nr:3-methyladenine glycosylase [Labilithrix sp.]
MARALEDLRRRAIARAHAATRVLVPVRTASFRPRGRYDVRRVRRWPVRALRGGHHGLAAAFRLVAGEVEITLLGVQPAHDVEDLERAMAAARGLVAVDDDPRPFLAIAGQHPLVARLAEHFDCHLDRAPTVFETFARAVIEQLVTVYEAKLSVRRLFYRTGELVAGTELRAAPLPAAVLGIPPWELHTMGIGSRRSRTLREGARRGAALERLRDVPPADAITRIQSLPGVGPWTANLVARNAFGYEDAVPVGDLHVPYLVSGALTGVRGGDEEMLEALACFRPHRARVVQLVMAAMVKDMLPGFDRMRSPLPRIDPHRREPWKY